MNNKAKLASCLAGIVLFGSLLAGSTFALYQSEKTINAHLVTGEFKAGLYLNSLTQDYLDEDGMINSETKDLSTYTGYEEGKGVNLVEYKNDVFSFENFVPTMTAEAEFTIYNTGNVAFEYAVNVVDIKGYVYDSETDKYVEASDATLISQIKIDLNYGENKVVSAGENVTFSVKCEFLDLPNNNDAMNQQVSFDIKVICSQVTKA